MEERRDIMTIAVFRNKSGVGLHAWTYIENKEGLENTDILRKNQLTEDDFPLLVDEQGLHIQFRTDMEGFVDIRENPLTREECYPKITDIRMFQCGWLSPKNEVIYCEPDKVFDCARMICEEGKVESDSPDTFLVELGWRQVTKEEYLKLVETAAR